jgi:hypothetical protein
VIYLKCSVSNGSIDGHGGLFTPTVLPSDVDALIRVITLPRLLFSNHNGGALHIATDYTGISISSPSRKQAASA